VEDNADSREMMAILLKSAGFECHAASDGLLGLELLDEVRPHAALVDIGLPGIDGLEFARRVRAHPTHRGVYLVAVTGYSQLADREMALRSGFDEHLVKPVAVAALTRLLTARPQRGRDATVVAAEQAD
jgi:two-component system CheB/CheR fusion protein